MGRQRLRMTGADFCDLRAGPAHYSWGTTHGCVAAVPGATPAGVSNMNECLATPGCHRLEMAGIDRPAGALAAAAWLDARGLRCTPGVRWYVDVVLEAGPSAGVAGAADSRFHIAISATDWGFVFRHRGRVSSLRVTDVASVQDRDDHGL